MSGEMSIPSDDSKTQFVDGFLIPAVCTADAFRSAFQYKPRDDDVFIATYPKCGTTWTLEIVHLIFRLGKPAESRMEFLASALFLDISGAKAAETMPRPGVLRTHLPFRVIPWSDKAKYIYVTRNPKDCCVSYYHMKNIPGYEFNLTFDQFFERFLSGTTVFGGYFDHLMGWYEHRNDPNVLFMTYEEMKENAEAAVLKIATFIDDEKYAKPLRDDPEKLQNVLKYSSFKYMKEVVNGYLGKVLNMPEEELLKSELPEPRKRMFMNMRFSLSAKVEKEYMEKNPPAITFLRKGIIGDWKNYFNEDQNKRMDRKFAEITKGTDLP